MKSGGYFISSLFLLVEFVALIRSELNLAKVHKIRRGNGCEVDLTVNELNGKENNFLLKEANRLANAAIGNANKLPDTFYGCNITTSQEYSFTQKVYSLEGSFVLTQNTEADADTLGQELIEDILKHRMDYSSPIFADNCVHESNAINRILPLINEISILDYFELVDAGTSGLIIATAVSNATSKAAVVLIYKKSMKAKAQLHVFLEQINAFRFRWLSNDELWDSGEISTVSNLIAIDYANFVLNNPEEDYAESEIRSGFIKTNHYFATFFEFQNSKENQFEIAIQHIEMAFSINELLNFHPDSLKEIEPEKYIYSCGGPISFATFYMILTATDIGIGFVSKDNVTVLALVVRNPPTTAIEELSIGNLLKLMKEVLPNLKLKWSHIQDDANDVAQQLMLMKPPHPEYGIGLIRNCIGTFFTNLYEETHGQLLIEFLQILQNLQSVEYTKRDTELWKPAGITKFLFWESEITPSISRNLLTNEITEFSFGCARHGNQVLFVTTFGPLPPMPSYIPLILEILENEKREFDPASPPFNQSEVTRLCWIAQVLIAEQSWKSENRIQVVFGVGVDYAATIFKIQLKEYCNSRKIKQEMDPIKNLLQILKTEISSLKNNNSWADGSDIYCKLEPSSNFQQILDTLSLEVTSYAQLLRHTTTSLGVASVQDTKTDELIFILTSPTPIITPEKDIFMKILNVHRRKLGKPKFNLNSAKSPCVEKYLAQLINGKGVKLKHGFGISIAGYMWTFIKYSESNFKDVLAIIQQISQVQMQENFHTYIASEAVELGNDSVIIDRSFFKSHKQLFCNNNPVSIGWTTDGETSVVVFVAKIGELPVIDTLLEALRPLREPTQDPLLQFELNYRALSYGNDLLATDISELQGFCLGQNIKASVSVFCNGEQNEKTDEELLLAQLQMIEEFTNTERASEEFIQNSASKQFGAIQKIHRGFSSVDRKAIQKADGIGCAVSRIEKKCAVVFMYFSS